MLMHSCRSYELLLLVAFEKRQNIITNALIVRLLCIKCSFYTFLSDFSIKSKMEK